jgi:hypothetical protein
MRLVWRASFCRAICAVVCRLPAAIAAGTAPWRCTNAAWSTRCAWHPSRALRPCSRAGRPRAASGRRIELQVAVVPALNRRETAAPLFLLAGGPGQAASDLYTELRRRFRTHQPQSRHRAGGPTRHGRSAPLMTCDYPDDWQDLGDDLAQLREATRSCLAKFGDRVRFYTSSAAVGDLDRGAHRLSAMRRSIVRLVLRDARGGALHAALSAIHPRGDSGWRDFPGAGHRTRYTVGWRACA